MGGRLDKSQSANLFLKYFYFKADSKEAYFDFTTLNQNQIISKDGNYKFIISGTDYKLITDNTVSFVHNQEQVYIAKDTETTINLNRTYGSAGKTLDKNDEDEQSYLNDKSNTTWLAYGDDYVEAKGGNDKIYAGSGEDIVVGGEGTDTIKGYTGDDILYGGKDEADINKNTKEYIDGEAGTDIAVYSGNFDEYIFRDKNKNVIQEPQSECWVIDTMPDRDGTDYIKNIEILQFADGYYDTINKSFNKGKIANDKIIYS